MNIPDEFGLFPFQRFTADELRHFFVWCAAHKVSDVDLPEHRERLQACGCCCRPAQMS
ncbi:hypothetical protein AB12_5133 [Escherichia coli 1-182-04_S1_C1]|nr:hypothetical protein AB12_5133 [Escherichia coli 1-182-04_S1_C1]